MNDWYASLAKPDWTPSGQVIGTIWTILYPIIFIAFGYMLFRVARQDAPTWLLFPIGVNLAANFAFTPVMFGLKNLPLATVDILIVLATIVWCAVAFWPYSKAASAAMLPYLAWVSTATVLQISITLMNRGRW